MFGFAEFKFGEEHERETELQAFAQLLVEAAELGVETGYCIELCRDMETHQLQAARAIVQQAIAEAEANAAAVLHPCPQGYAWRPEGDGFRCEGGTHYCTRDEIRQYMRSR